MTRSFLQSEHLASTEEMNESKIHKEHKEFAECSPRRFYSTLRIFRCFCTDTCRVTGNSTQRCRSRQILGVRRIFARILPNLPAKTPEKVTSKKLCSFGRHIFHIKASWAPFCSYIQGVCSDFQGFVKVFREFAKIRLIFPGLKEFSRDFHQIKPFHSLQSQYPLATAFNRHFWHHVLSQSSQLLFATTQTLNSLQKAEGLNQSATFFIGNRFHATLRILSPTVFT